MEATFTIRRCFFLLVLSGHNLPSLFSLSVTPHRLTAEPEGRMEHIFQVNGFRNFAVNDMRHSPVRIHNFASGSLTSKIEVLNLGDLTGVYLSLRCSKERNICTDVSVTFDIINQYSLHPYSDSCQQHLCGLFGNQVYGCQFLTSRILTEPGLCIDDVITIQVKFCMPSNGMIAPCFGDPSLLTSINYQTASWNAKLFMQSEISDISFQVGVNNSDLFYGHKAIIATACPVLKEMIRRSKDPIVVEDVARTVFLTIMRYIYCHEIVIDKGYVYETLVAADKFDIPEIMFSIAALIDMDILPIVFNYTTASEKDKLGFLCSYHMRSNVTSFLGPECFMLLTQASVARVVGDEELVCDEIVLWKTCVSWAEQECERRSQGKATTVQEKRRVMKSFLSNFRFKYMPLEEFTRGPADSGILKLTEVVDVYKYFASAIPLTMFTNASRGSGGTRRGSTASCGPPSLS